MNTKKIFIVALFTCLSLVGISQTIGIVDKRSKEFTVPRDLKVDYQVFGYQFPNITTRKMICFSSHVADVKDNFNQCPLGAYFDTGKMRPDDKIVYAGQAGKFARMVYVTGSGKKTVFYLSKSSFMIK